MQEVHLIIKINFIHFKSLTVSLTPEENFENFIFKSINLMPFERKIKQNYKTV